MTNEARVKPQLRFKQFDEAWLKLNLNEVSDRVKRKNKGLESLMPLTISGQYGLVDQITYFSKSVSAKNLENYTLIKNGEFAYNKSYSNGYPLGAIKRLDKYEKGALSTLYICFKVKENHNSNFLKYFFETTKWHKEVSSIAVEGARNHGLLNISVNDFFNIMISLPPIKEQQKIGDFFSKLDRQIELEEQKLEKLEQQKKGYMQKIFSQQLRFKDEKGNDYSDWEIQGLDQIAEINTGKSKISHEIDGEFFNLGSTGIVGKSNHFEYEGSFLLTARVGHYAGSLYTFKGKANISDNTIFIQTNLYLEFIEELLNNYLDQDNHLLNLQN
jgi:type I restriction enzyme S subunit